MPRPLRKPKRFNPSKSQVSSTVVVSTPIHPNRPTSAFASPGLSPIQNENDFAIYHDKAGNGPELDEFGISRVNGIKRPITRKQTNSEIDEDLPTDDDLPADDEEEDIYGEPAYPTDMNEPPSTADIESPSTPAPHPKPKKPIRHLRTSELLSLLPTRRKRIPHRPSKKMSSLNTSD